MSQVLSPSDAAPAGVASPAAALADDAERVGIRHWVLAAVLATVFALALSPATDPDLFWHLATGRWILAHHSVPRVDPFSWTVPGRRWIAHEWLTEVAFQGLHRAGGWAALILGAAVVITTGWLIVHRTARNLGARAGWSGFMMALAAVSSLHTWGVRPQMLSLMLSALTMQRLQRWHAGLSRRVPWELVAVSALWANLHGGFIFGIAITAIFAIGTTATVVADRLLSPAQAERVRAGRAPRTTRDVASIWGLVAGCTAATLATPNGLAGLLYPFSYLGDNASTRYVGEWFAPDFTKAQFWPYALLVLLAVLCLIRCHRHLGITELGLMVPFCAMGVQSVRNITLAGIVCAPIIAAAFTRRDDAAYAKRFERRAARAARRASAAGGSAREVTPQQATRIVGSILGPLIVALIVLASGDLGVAANEKAQAGTQSPAAATWLAAHPGGRLLNHYNFGGWLIWHHVPVYVDGRPDMYGDAYMDSYVHLTSMKGDWKGEVRRQGIDRVLMPTKNAMTVALRKDPAWRVQTQDAVAVLLVRR